MLEVCYQELNLIQVLDILRCGGLARLALCADGRPYVVPMAFQLEAAGAQPILHLASPGKGRKMDILRRNSHVCLEVERASCAWIDTVLAEGQITAGIAEGGGVLLQLLPENISGRRYFITS